MSVFGGSDAARRPQKRARTIAKEEKNLTNALAGAMDDTDADYEFICSDLLDGPPARITQVAKILRKKILEKVDIAGMENDDTLTDKTTKYRHLKSKQLVQLLKKMVPSLATREGAGLDDLPRATLMNWVTVGLGVKEAMNLPDSYPTLRSIDILGDYCAARHTQLGSRLSYLEGVGNLSEATPPNYFTLDQDNDQVIVNFLRDGNQVARRFAFTFEGADDWEIKKNHSWDAELISDSLSVKVALAARAGKKLGVTIEREIVDWNLPPADVPASVTGATAAAASSSAGAAGSSATPKAKAKATAAKAPPGSGSARARGGRGGQ